MGLGKYELPAPFFSATPSGAIARFSHKARGGAEEKVYTGAAVSVPRKAYQAADMLMAAVLPHPRPVPPPPFRDILHPGHRAAEREGGGCSLVGGG